MLRHLVNLHRRLGLKYRFDLARHYVRRFGLRGAYAARRILWERAGCIRMDVPGLPHAVQLRSGTADASTFEKMFVWNAYDLDAPAEPKVILDAGANIGLSSIFFATRFPHARVIALEPQRDNFALLVANTAPYSNIEPVRGALWSEDGELGLANPDAPVDSYRFDPAADDRVKAFSVASLLEHLEIDRFDIVKMDIEGGETEVFQAPGRWIDDVLMFVVELHGPDAEAAFTRATAHLQGRRYRHGEDTVLARHPR